MKKSLIVLVALLAVGTAHSAETNTTKNFKRTSLSLSVGSASMSINAGSYSDPGVTLAFGYFFLPKLSLNGHYFAAAAPSGASNMNGPGLQARYYFYNTETTFELDHRGGRITSYDKYYAFGSLGFLDRQIRTSRTTESYTGFGVSLGGGMKINTSNSLFFEITQAKLKSPAGTLEEDTGTFTNFSIGFSHLF